MMTMTMVTNRCVSNSNIVQRISTDNQTKECGNGQSPTLEYELIPIDHGYTLPQTISGLNDLWFEWLKWPQAKVPFGEEELQYIERLNPDEGKTFAHCFVE